MMPHLSLHPHTFTSHFPHTPRHPRALFLSLSLPLSSLFLYFSPQIIANHHMQSISFASGGDPVSHPPTHTVSSSPPLSPFCSPFSIFSSYISFLPVFLHCLFLCVSLTPIILTGLQAFPSELHLVTSCHSTFNSMNVFKFSHDSNSEVCALSHPFFLSTFLSLFCPSHFLLLKFPIPSS